MSLLRRTSALVNQIAKRINSTGRAYSEDLAEIREGQEEICNMMKMLINKITTVK